MIITAEGKKQDELKELFVAAKIVESCGVDKDRKSTRLNSSHR